jgi:pimeloyl-ACP methyl ester carboxylesterase
MTSRAIAASSSEPRAARYRTAERALWGHYGLEPTERFIQLDSPRIRLRVLEVGSGKPLLFVHGTVGPGSWPSLIGELHGVRCIVLDRPGWGPSQPLDFSRYDYRKVVADVMRGVLDALDLETVDVVGGSIGDVWALSLAEHHPARVDRVVLLGGGPIAPDVSVPAFIRVLASRIGAIVARLPMKPDRVRSILRDNGHGASLDAGRIPDLFLDWRASLANDTASTRHERDMVRTILWSSGWKPGFMYDDSQLSRVDHPTLMVYGTADPAGSVDVWRRVVGALPNGELQLIEGAGHMPWFDDARLVAAHVERFLAA